MRRVERVGAGAPSAPPRRPRASGRRRPGARSSIDLAGDRLEGARAPRRRGRRRAARAGSRSARASLAGLVATASCSLLERGCRCRPRRAAPRPPATSSSAASSSALGTCLSRNLRTSRLGQRADEAVDRLAALEQHAERDAAHAEHLRQLGGDLGLLVGVELGQLEAAGVGGLELLEHRAERLARAAPRRPDVEQHRLLHRGVDQLGFEVLEGDVDHGVGSGSEAVGAAEVTAPPTIQAVFHAPRERRLEQAPRRSSAW